MPLSEVSFQLDSGEVENAISNIPLKHHRLRRGLDLLYSIYTIRGSMVRLIELLSRPLHNTERSRMERQLHRLDRRPLDLSKTLGS